MMIKKKIQLLKPIKNKHILDYGCGFGGFFNLTKNI